MHWISQLASRGQRTALLINGESISYASLARRITASEIQISGMLSPEINRRPLVLLAIKNTPASIAYYLACLKQGWPAILVNPQLNTDAFRQLINAFQPNVIIAEDSPLAGSTTAHELDDKLALLLMTSGSTGGGKAVALSYANVAANTQSICDYLPIESTDIAYSPLPLSYSYGLSVLNTHLATGACLLLSSLTVMDKAFWPMLENAGVSSLAGVPTWYDMLVRLRYTRRALSTLRYFTQAGGKLTLGTLNALREFADINNSDLFRMYGQTEATARMGWLSPAKAFSKPDAIGKAVPGGHFFLRDRSGEIIRSDNTVGELCYRGENCMLGYVSDVGELACFSGLPFLATGDLAARDHDGDYLIKGRIKRIVKLAGERVSLDGLENLFGQQQLEVRCVGNDNQLYIGCQPGQNNTVAKLARAWLACPPSFYTIAAIAAWPELPNGKIDYARLQQMLTGDNQVPRE